jgi:CheY-like chemotaxis protein
LAKFGYKSVETADDGEEAVASVQRARNSADPFQLIFMDMEMPVDFLINI